VQLGQFKALLKKEQNFELPVHSALRPKIDMPESDEKFILKTLARNLYLQGVISEDQVNDTELIKKLIVDGMDKFGGLFLVTDHRDDLLKHANYFSDIGSKSMAIVMYAMYFEHAINAVIVKTLDKDGIKNKTKNEMLRSASLKAKLSWILELLDLPSFNEEHRKFILRVADERNAFVHYKFNAINADEDTDKVVDILLSTVKKTVRYMKSYSTRVEYKGKKHAIESRFSEL
jgi:hypothetical protein